ncbi:MAG: hypothetical protein KGQ59_11970 [Bdellovibrionales bacterium]|nr:hypothetical protein [Bdellovibrionales bacterium]
MEKEKSKVRVLDLGTDQVLFECDVAESEKAYKFAAEMEQLGLEVKVNSPTLSDTLSTSLGLSNSQLAAYKASLEDEIESHEAGCCVEERPKNLN